MMHRLATLKGGSDFFVNVHFVVILYKVTPQVDKHLSANTNMSKKRIIIVNFLGGLSWGFGTVVGASVVVAIIGYILSLFGVLDVFKITPQISK